MEVDTDYRSRTDINYVMSRDCPKKAQGNMVKHPTYMFMPISRWYWLKIYWYKSEMEIKHSTHQQWLVWTENTKSLLFRLVKIAPEYNPANTADEKGNQLDCECSIINCYILWRMWEVYKFTANALTTNKISQTDIKHKYGIMNCRLLTTKRVSKKQKVMKQAFQNLVLLCSLEN